MKKMSMLISCILAALLLSGLFNNCSEVEFADAVSSKSVGEVLGEPGIEDIISNCQEALANGQLKMSQSTINFADTKIETGLSNVCPYKSGPASDNTPDAFGNFTEKNEYLRARYEQYRTINLPENSVVCDVKITAPSQNFEYDDMIYITYNDYILASSIDRSVSEAGAKVESVFYPNIGNGVSLYKYAWEDVANFSFAGMGGANTNDYCAGGANGYGSCEWPVTQVTGPISMAYESEVLVPISSLTNNHKFGFIVTGDNDPSSDCYHENLDLDVEFTYFELTQ